MHDAHRLREKRSDQRDTSETSAINCRGENITGKNHRTNDFYYLPPHAIGSVDGVTPSPSYRNNVGDAFEQRNPATDYREKRIPGLGSRFLARRNACDHWKAWSAR